MGAGKNFIEDEGVMPEKVPYESGWPEMDGIGQNTHAEVRKTLEPSKKNSVPTKTQLDQTMAVFLKNLEESENQTNIQKARKLRMALILIGRHVNVDLGKIRVKELPGLAIGEAKDGHVEIDPILFNNKKFTAEHLALIRHALLHELTHLEKKVDNEWLTEIFSAQFSQDKIRDYEDGINNVMQVVSLLSSDKDAGILEAVNLYGEGKYDELYERFENAYAEKYPEKVKENPDVAFNIFQLAFPELKADGEGNMVEDTEAVDEAFEDAAFE